MRNNYIFDENSQNFNNSLTRNSKFSILQKISTKYTLLLIGMLFFFFSNSALASHYRHGNLSWRVVSGNTVEFKISQAYANYGNWTVGQTGYGDNLNFGDGQSQSFSVVVTSVNTAENYYYGETTVTHTYANIGNFTAYFSSCCRIGNLVNNANGSWYVGTMVNVGTGNSSPVSTLPPLVNLPLGVSNATFQIPAFDQDGNTLSYRLATSSEMGGGTNPAGLSVNASTGLVTFNTIGKSIGQLYSAAIVVSDGFTTVTLDFIIKVTQQSIAPYFDYSMTPSNATVYQVSPGQNVSFVVKAADQDAGDVVSLQGIGLPVGSTMSPTFPVSGNPVQSTFSWTPTISKLGTNVINFIAQDAQGVQASTSITIVVSLKPTFNTPPTPALNSVLAVVPGQAVSATIQAADPDPLDHVIISGIEIPAGMTFSPSIPTAALNPASTSLSWTPAASQWGDHEVTFRATDSYGDFVNHSFEYVVNTPPVFASTAASSINVGATYSYNVLATDADIPYGDEVEIVNSSILPSWLSLTVTGNGTALLTGVPSIADAGTYTIVLFAEDIHHHASATIPSQTFTITVNPCNITLSESHINVSCYGLGNGSIDVSGMGVNAPATYSWTGSNSFSASTEDVSNLQPGSYTLNILDNFGCTASISASITQPVNVTPIASNDNATVCAGSAININVLGNDSHPQGLALTISDNTLPSVGSLVKNANNTFTYNAPASAPSQVTFTYTVKANDGVIANASNNHYYEWVPAYGISWTQAKADATTKTFNGMQGYLVTVTSAAEMAFVAAKLQGSGWMGASDLNYEGTWRWVTGPEGQENGGLGRHFSNQFKYNSCGASQAPGINGNYANWAGGEPNDCGANVGQYSPSDVNRGGEHYAHFYGGGIWNDYPNNVGGSVVGYIVEYGGLESCTPILTSTATVTININPKPVVSAVASNVTCLGGNDGSVDLSVATGATPYTFAWSNGASTEDISTVAVGTYSVSVADANGCTNSTSSSIIQVDPIFPTAIAQNLTISLDANGAASITAAQINNGSYDNCGIASMSVSPSTFACSNFGANNVTLTITDLSGNVSTANAVVTVEDHIAPIAIAQDLTVSLDASGSASITAAQINNGSSDACGIATMSVTPDNFSCSNFGANTVILTVTDIHGNVSTASAVVIVEDHIAPIAIAQNLTVSLDASGSASITATQINNGSSDACGIATMSVSPDNFSCSNFGANTVVLTVTDIHGNLSTASAVVTVEDHIAPVVVTKNISVTLSSGSASITASQVNNGSSDACGIASLAVSPSTFNCSNLGANTVTLTVTDVHGNVSSSTATVSVIGAIPTVSIAQSLQPAFTQGGAIILTASSPTAIDYAWTGGPANEIYNVYASGTYTVVVTNSYGCTFSASSAVNYVPSNILSNYTIIGKKEAELEDHSYLYNGGMGATDVKGEAELEKSSFATATGTFVRAAEIEIKDGSAATTKIYSAVPLSILPAFLSNPYSSNNNKNIAQNAVVTINDSIIGELVIGKNAKVTFSRPRIYVKGMNIGEGAVIKFLNCAEIRVKNEVNLHKSVSFNKVSPRIVTLYLGGDLHVEEGAQVEANVYSAKKIEIHGSSSSVVNMKGMFIADEVKAEKYVNFYWNTASQCGTVQRVAENEEETIVSESSISSRIYPNPSNNLFNLQISTPNEAPYTVYVMDVSGKILNQKTELQPTEEFQFGEDLSNGVYFVKIIQGDYVQTIKIIKVQ